MTMIASRGVWGAPSAAALLEDEDLIEQVAAGDEAALQEALARFRPYVAGLVRPYFLQGGDAQDVLQEGMIGLYKAIRDFDPAREASFRSFAALCVRRQVVSAIRGAARLKHQPLNTSTSLDAPAGADDDGAPALADRLVDDGVDPAAQLVAAVDLAGLHQLLADILSDLEVEVLRRYVAGDSYAEIAAALDRGTKAVDNAVQRIRRKLSERLEVVRAEAA